MANARHCHHAVQIKLTRFAQVTVKPFLCQEDYDRYKSIQQALTGEIFVA